MFGDIGTSPLYAMQVIFGQHKQAAHTTIPGVYGIVSLIFWALVIIVSIKYAIVIMRAHNRGDGGIMALAALISRKKVPRAAILITLGLLRRRPVLRRRDDHPGDLGHVRGRGTEGRHAGDPGRLIVPIALVILISLFAAQRFGTGAVGWLFGPVMLLWFGTIGVLGAGHVVQHPAVLQALSPTWGARFMLDHGVAAWLTLGGVVLAVTGAEALYADRGHFGATPIRMTWFAIVFPAVLLNYLGQGALILSDHKAIANPFYLLAPSWAQLPLVFLATAATIIASQAAMTGSFSVAKQAVQLGFMPRLRIVHTAEVEGQIYVPIINWLLCAGVVALVLVFRNSNRLSDIYGVAVTGTFILDTTLFVAVARSLWHTPKWRLLPMAGLFYLVEVSFFSANVTKVEHGAWLPLLIGVIVANVMLTWRKGRDDADAQPGRRGGIAAGVPRGPVLGRPTDRPAAGDRDLPEPQQADDAAGDAGPGRASARLPGDGRDGLARPDPDPARRQGRPVRRRAARQGHVQDHLPDDPDRLPRPDEPARRARAGPQAGDAAAQLRSRARLLLRQPHVDRPDRRAGDAPLAQAPVHHDGAQLVEPDRAFGLPADRTVSMTSEIAV